MTSTIKVDNIVKVSDDSNIIKKCGSTITIGSSGQTVAVASGATTSGMGRTGTVDWDTTPKTSTFTGANGIGYFVNTSGGAVTLNLPAGSAGNIIAVADYTRTFQTANLTVAPNGSQKMGGVATVVSLSTEGQSATFIYVDNTEGWVNIQETSNSISGNPNLSATGGTITTSGNFKIHTFTSPGTFQVTSTSTTPAENTVGYMVVAGGGGGSGAGAGAGGLREGRNAPIDNFTASPLVANAPTNAVTVTAQSYSILVGAGGAGANPSYSGTGKANGSNSVFSSITSTGGGSGGAVGTDAGGNGGSGGGAGNTCTGSGAVGTGNTPPVSPAQGFPGGTSSPGPVNAVGMGAGGGASAVGTNGTSGTSPGGSAGSGGNGVTSSISASPVTRAGGGGGAAQGTSTNPNRNNGGTGGGGNGGTGNVPLADGNGTANTGGGGAGGGFPGTIPGGTGGSGIVIIRYKFQ